MKYIGVSFCLLILGCSHLNLPKEVIEQHNNGASYTLSETETQFTFKGALDNISQKPYTHIHGEVWSVTFNIEKVVIGSYDNEKVHIGIPYKEKTTFKKESKYYITVDWGRDGMLLMGYHEIK